MNNQILFATHNEGKINEISIPFKEKGFNILSLASFPNCTEEVEETGKSFKDNALLKARYYAQKTNCITLADDSGLEVMILNNAPGIYSARYAAMENDKEIINLNVSKDKKNILQLLKNLNGISDRRARFCCCLAMVFPLKSKELISFGYWNGFIGLAPKGEFGFGYDPLFIDEKTGKTAALMLPEEKRACSHRAMAINGLILQLNEIM